MVKKFELPPLPYDFNALEPVISAEIMELHWDKHHRAYVTKLNEALEKYEAAQSNNDLAQMIAIDKAIKFNGGGNVNHSIFWTNLAPVGKGGGELPTGNLLKAINETFGSIEKLIELMSAKAVDIQGSGWAWLGYNKANGKLELAICKNQNPLSLKGLVPLLGIDVWEHAYYLQYKNVRANYVKKIWDVVNWKNVEERYTNAVSA